MRIIFGSDEKTNLTDFIGKWLQEHGHIVEKAGHLASENKKWHWADIGREVAEKVTKGEADYGVVCCWSGTGVCMAANKVKGARAALCLDSETAKLTRKWNDSNVLCLSLRFTSETVTSEILEKWFSTTFDEEGLGQKGKLDC